MSTQYYNFITSQQCRMARAALNITVRDLAEATGLSAMTITRFENGKNKGSPDTLQTIAAAFQGRGIVFIPADDDLGPGVRLILEDGEKEAMQPQTYDQKTAEIICDILSDGTPLSSVAQDSTMPSLSTINRWRRENKWFREEVMKWMRLRGRG
ncbi:MAG: hypothetical protein CMN56_05285 [Sneathiella sp.]|nr:hypothetical protein [Sneathiella sp.]